MIKAIVKLLPEQKIQIIPSKTSAFDEKKFNVTLNLNPEKYRTIGGRASSRSPSITLAHELIHALHFLKNSNDFFIRKCIKDETIDNMDDLEEQRTIVGFDNRIFSKDGIENKLDILCENAFLLALGLPPRIDHLAADYEEDFDQNNQYTFDSYFEWLKNAVSNISHIPIERTNDKDFFIKYISLNPAAIPTLPEKLKNDDEFMLELILTSENFMNVVHH